MRLWLSRWVTSGVEENLVRCDEECARATDAGAELVVFPELFLTGYGGGLAPGRARGLFAEISGRHPETLYVFGTVDEDGRNRLTAWLGGREVARYDKICLFRPNREHELWSPGERVTALRWHGLTIVFLVCNDVRFPELARALRLEAGCDLLLAPAWWPWRRDHVWRTLLRARALENACWVAGCCVAAALGDAEFAGAGNHVFGPLGEPAPTADDRSYDLAVERPPELIVDPLALPLPSFSVEVVEADHR